MGGELEAGRVEEERGGGRGGVAAAQPERSVATEKWGSGEASVEDREREKGRKKCAFHGESVDKKIFLKLNHIL